MAYTTINNPELYFNTVLWTGTGSSMNITGVGFQPDWTWIKPRSVTDNHVLFDSVRGVTKRLVSNLNSAEVTVSDMITSFDSDGFSLGTNSNVSGSGTTFVGWSWVAGGSASANSDGGTSSSVSVNTTAGFSIVNWAGSSSASVQTIGHGLGTTPHWILTKNRGAGSSITAWINYHHKIDASAPEDFTIYMNNTDARVDNSVHGDTKPTSSVFSFNTGTDDQNYISYCFTEKKGFSKFGSYTGNGNADGNFIYTGFKPAFILLKNTGNGSAEWRIYDNKRDPSNVMTKCLQPHSTDAEETTSNIDFLSNGWKVRSNDGNLNQSGYSFIYMAFAESPFVTSTGIPTTAR